MNASTINDYLKAIEMLCSNEIDNKDVSEYFMELSKECQSIRYDNYILWFMIADSIILVAILYYLYGDTVPEYLFGGFIVSFVCAEIIHERYRRINWLNECLENLYEKNLLGVRKVPIKKNLRSMFLEFKRGNFVNKIEQVSRAKDNSFDLIRYHWINKCYVIESKSNSQRVQYYNFFRDCIAFKTNIYENIWIQSVPIYEGGITWTTAYERFNKNFTVKCDREIVAAKVLTPPIVLKIDEISKTINSLNIEFRNSGFVLISMPNGSLQTKTKISVNDVPAVAKTFADGRNHNLELILQLKGLLINVKTKQTNKN